MRAEEIARVVGGTIKGEENREIQGVASLESAEASHLSFAEGAKAIKAAASSRAGCILVPEGVLLPGLTTIEVARPKWALVQAAALLLPKAAGKAEIHSTAMVDAAASLAPDVSVGPYVVIERGVRVGAGTRLDDAVFLGENAQVGSACHFYPRVTIYAGAIIGNRVILHSGAVVGSDGFGYVTVERRHHKFPQTGKVIVGDDVEIGSNTTVDRGSLGETVIGEGTKIDNLVQIAHNVRIGRNCLIAAQTGISGSTEVGDNVVMAGQVGVGDHVRVESNVTIGGQAGVLNNKIIRRGTVLWGTPARPFAEFKRIYARLASHPDAVGRRRNSAGGKTAQTP